jgi:hypothetical protein
MQGTWNLWRRILRIGVVINFLLAICLIIIFNLGKLLHRKGVIGIGTKKVVGGSLKTLEFVLGNLGQFLGGSLPDLAGSSVGSTPYILLGLLALLLLDTGTGRSLRWHGAVFSETNCLLDLVEANLGSLLVKLVYTWL